MSKYEEVSTAWFSEKRESDIIEVSPTLEEWKRIQSGENVRPPKIKIKKQKKHGQF